MTLSSSLHFLSASTSRRSRLAHLPSLEHLVAQKQVARDACGAGNCVTQDTEAVVDAHLDRVHGLAERQVQTSDVPLGVLILECGYYVVVSMLSRQNVEKVAVRSWHLRQS